MKGKKVKPVTIATHKRNVMRALRAGKFDPAHMDDLARQIALTKLLAVEKEKTAAAQREMVQWRVRFFDLERQRTVDITNAIEQCREINTSKHIDVIHSKAADLVRFIEEAEVVS